MSDKCTLEEDQYLKIYEDAIKCRAERAIEQKREDMIELRRIYRQAIMDAMDAMDEVSELFISDDTREATREKLREIDKKVIENLKEELCGFLKRCIEIAQ